MVLLAESANCTLSHNQLAGPDKISLFCNQVLQMRNQYLCGPCNAHYFPDIETCVRKTAKFRCFSHACINIRKLERVAGTTEILISVLENWLLNIMKISPDCRESSHLSM